MYDKYALFFPNDLKQDCANLIKNKEKNKIHKIFEYESIKYEVYMVDEINSVYYSIQENHWVSSSGYLAFIIIYKNKKYAELYDLSFNSGDLTFYIKSFNHKRVGYNDDYNEFSEGLNLINASVKFIKELKELYGIKYITLRDYSTNTCHNVNLNLGLLNTFLKGYTLYGKIGFEPIKNKEEYELNKRIINSIKVKDCNTLKKYIIKSTKKVYIKKIKELKPIIASFKKQYAEYEHPHLVYELKTKIEKINRWIDEYNSLKFTSKLLIKYENDMLSLFLKEYLKREDDYSIFLLFYKQLAEDIGLVNFFGRIFIKRI